MVFSIWSHPKHISTSWVLYCVKHLRTLLLNKTTFTGFSKEILYSFVSRAPEREEIKYKYYLGVNMLS